MTDSNSTLIGKLEDFKAHYGANGQTVIESCIGVIRRHFEEPSNDPKVTYAAGFDEGAAWQRNRKTVVSSEIRLNAKEMKAHVSGLIYNCTGQNQPALASLIVDYCIDIAPKRESGGDWQPMETAPKDGTKIIAFAYDIYSNQQRAEMHTTYWSNGRWARFTTHYVPTHWMPLPKPPLPGEECRYDEHRD